MAIPAGTVWARPYSERTRRAISSAAAAASSVVSGWLASASCSSSVGTSATRSISGRRMVFDAVAGETLTGHLATITSQAEHDFIAGMASFAIHKGLYGAFIVDPDPDAVVAGEIEARLEPVGDGVDVVSFFAGGAMLLYLAIVRLFFQQPIADRPLTLLGILLTMPFSFCVVYAAFDDIIGISN